MEKSLSETVLGDWQALSSGYISYEMQVVCPGAVGLYEPGVQRWYLGFRPQFGS